MSEPKNGYVVYWCERLRDGREEGARCFSRLEEALECINEFKDAGRNLDVALYEIGKQIKIEEVKEEQPQPPVVKSIYRVKEETRITKIKGLE